MARLLTILIVGLLCEAIGVVFLSRGLKEIIWFFSVHDIKDVSSLVEKLSRHSDPVSALVWERLAPAEQRALSARAALPVHTKRVLATALNRLVVGSPIGNVHRLAELPWSDETRALLAQDPKGPEVVHLNRLVLQEAYAAELASANSPGASVAQVLRLVGRGVTNVHILLGILFEALFFVGLLMLMSKGEVSFVWPLTSLSFVVTTIAAKIYLHEYVSPLRWSGVCLIMLGAALISWSERQKNQTPSAAPLVESPARGTLSPQ